MAKIYKGIMISSAFGSAGFLSRVQLLLLFVFLQVTFLNAQTIEKVEPPFWWAGMQSPTLQLMVYGENISTI